MIEIEKGPGLASKESRSGPILSIDKILLILKKRGVDPRFSQLTKRHVRRRTCDFYASGTSPFRALATLRAAAVIVRSSTFTVTSAYFS